MGNPPQAAAPNQSPLSTQKVVWAAAILALSNIAALLKELRDVIEGAQDLVIAIPSQIPPWVIQSILAVLMVIGNVILVRFVLKKLKTEISTGKRVLAASLTAVAISLIVVLNVHALSELRVNPSLIRTRLVTEIAGAQQPGNIAGFADFANNQGTPDDPWTTAQATKAILVANDKLDTKQRERLKAAFRYLKTKQESPGYWNADPSGGQPFLRIEISCWVALAYLESLRRTDFWTEEENNEAVKHVISIVSSIVNVQDTTGAWAPIIKANAEFDRTYPTLMAVWALSDAVRAEILPPDFRKSIGENLERGILWLIQAYRPDYGWDENPRRHIGRKFDGLTFEILLVLKSAEDIPAYNSFKDTEKYKSIKRNIVNLIPEPFSIQDSFAIPSSDQGVDGKQCWATFLAYPWSLAALTAMSRDPDIPSSDRRKLNQIRQKEFQKLDKLPEYLKDAETWLVAENVIGLVATMKKNGRI